MIYKTENKCIVGDIVYIVEKNNFSTGEIVTVSDCGDHDKIQYEIGNSKIKASVKNCENSIPRGFDKDMYLNYYN